MNIDLTEVLRLASSKWNFLKFNPGLVGGHCLPVDPYYLSYIAKKNNIKLKTLLAGREVNNHMKVFILNKIKKYVKTFSNIKNSVPNVLVCGLTYKNDVSDIRNSLSLEIFLKLKKSLKSVIGYDYVCNDIVVKKYKIRKNIDKIKNKIDIAVFLVNHKKNIELFNYFNKKGVKILDPFYFYK